MEIETINYKGIELVLNFTVYEDKAINITKIFVGDIDIKSMLTDLQTDEIYRITMARISQTL
jgi:hypothetical protein